jgi:steroid delta-isomerase-like uncharacterized protein
MFGRGPAPRIESAGTVVPAGSGSKGKGVMAMTSLVEKQKTKIDAFNRGDFDASASVFAESATFTDHARGIVLRGRREIRDWCAGWKASFSDARITDPVYMATGTASIARYVGRGTNDGLLGELPATGRSVAFPNCEIFEYDAEGQVVRAEVYYNQLSILQQLGLATEPSTAGASG